MKKTYSIRSIFTFFLVVTVVVMLVIIYIFQTTYFESFYRNNKIKEMTKIASMITNSMEKGNFENTLNKINLESDVCIRIDVGGTSITGNRLNRTCALDFLNDVQVNILYHDTAMDNNYRLFQNYSMTQYGTKIEDLYILTSITEYNGIQALIMVSTIVSPLEPMIKTLESQFIFISGVLIIMTLLLAYTLSIIFIRPLVEMKNQAKLISDNGYDGSKIKTRVKTLDEINNTLTKSQELIKQADVARKELLSNVSHDLRTPLTMIVGYGEMIKDFKDENNEENINVIIDEAKRLSALVDDLLDLSNGELGRLKLNKEDVNIRTISDSVANQYANYLKANNVKFIYECKIDEIVNVDYNRLRQVLYNFINNAYNYTDKENPLIRFEVIKDNNEVVISVFDNGEGIEEKDLDNIWNRYYKVDHEHKRFGVGSGIGLSICKIILDEHQIKYKVESRKGVYTKFIIYIPIITQL